MAFDTDSVNFLINSCNYGDEKTVKELLPFLKTDDSSNIGALHVAIRRACIFGTLEIVKIIIDHLQSLQKLSLKSVTASLRCAAQKDHYMIVKYLLSYLNDQKEILIDSLARCAPYFVQYGHFEDSQMIFEIRGFSLTRHIVAIGNTVLKASAFGHLNYLLKLLEYIGPSHTHILKNIDHYIVAAASNGNIEVIKALMSYDHQKRFAHYIQHAVFAAISNEHQPMLRFLLDLSYRKYTLLPKSFECAVQIAVEKGNLEMISFIMQYYPASYDQVSLILNQLRFACENGYFKVCQFFIEACQKHFEPSCFLNYGFNEAASNGHLDIVVLFLEHVGYADNIASVTGRKKRITGRRLWILFKSLLCIPHIKDSATNELHFILAFNSAASNGYVDILNIMLKCMNTSFYTRLGRTAIPHAARVGHCHVINYLLDSTQLTSIEKITICKEAVLMAAENGHLEAFKILLEIVLADIDIETTLMISIRLAATRGYVEIVDLVLKRNFSFSDDAVCKIFAKMPEICRNEHTEIIKILTRYFCKYESLILLVENAVELVDLEFGILQEAVSGNLNENRMSLITFINSLAPNKRCKLKEISKDFKQCCSLIIDHSAYETVCLSCYSTNQEIENENCLVTEDNYLNIIVRLKCHPTHVFHLNCIHQWFKLLFTCPVCRYCFTLVS